MRKHTGATREYPLWLSSSERARIEAQKDVGPAENKVARGPAISQRRLSALSSETSKDTSRPLQKPQKRVICPICSEIVEDAVGKRKGHDAIFCDGACHEWVHRQCAGLSKASFETASASDLPFFCPRCLLLQQANEISALKKSLEELTLEFASLKNLVSSMRTSGSQVSSATCVGSLSPSSHNQPQQLPSSQPPPETHSRPHPSHRKNLILFSLALLSLLQALDIITG